MSDSNTMVNRKKYIVILILFLVLILSCKSRNNILRYPDNNVKKITLLSDSISIDILNLGGKSCFVHKLNPRERALYEANHYWDSINLEDTTITYNDSYMRSVVANFIGLVSSVDSIESKKLICIPLEKSNDKSLRKILYIYYIYLYRYSSLLKNLYLYDSVLSWCLTSSKINDAEKVKAGNLLATIRRNKINSLSEDFEYLGIDSVKRRMHRGHAKRMLLIFYSPDCYLCRNEATTMSKNEILSNFVKQNILDILFIYPGSNTILWTENLDMIPSFAKVGIAYDDIISKGIYDIQAWPTIYLLDENKYVIMKDCELKDVINYIEKNH